MRTSAATPTLSRSVFASPWMFFAMALGWSWFFWTSMILFDLSIESAGGILAIMGLFGPLVAGLVCLYITQGQAARHDYWQRIIDFKRIGARWYWVIVLFVPLLMALSVALDMLFGGTGGVWESSALEIFAAPWMLVPFAFSIMLVGPVEEFGWRGYVLDRLQMHWSALSASLILGVMWSLWHLPLFFIKDTYQNSLGVGSLSFWLFMIGIVPLSVVFSWIFNNTQRSTLAAMLFHFMVNFTGQLVALTPSAEFVSILLWTVAAIVVVIVWGSKSMTNFRRQR